MAALAVTFALFASGSLRFVQSATVTKYSELAPSDVRAVAVAARADAWPTPLEAALAPLGFREQAVGCAHVYVRAG